MARRRRSPHIPPAAVRSAIGGRRWARVRRGSVNTCARPVTVAATPCRLSRGATRAGGSGAQRVVDAAPAGSTTSQRVLRDDACVSRARAMIAAPLVTASCALSHRLGPCSMRDWLSPPSVSRGALLLPPWSAAAHPWVVRVPPGACREGRRRQASRASATSTSLIRPRRRGTPPGLRGSRGPRPASRPR